MQNNMVKTLKEIKYIKKAADIIDTIYEEVLDTIEAGITERELADKIYNRVIELGGEDVSFPTIVAFGPNGCEPHHEPTDTVLTEGMMVTIDMGAVVNGYCSDFTRTFAYGEINEEQKKVYDVVYNAQKLAMQAVADEVDCILVDTIARDYIKDQGYGDFYPHGTGHGVGREIHENPFLNTKTTEVLKDNMVVTVEPGVYLPGKMGVRIEDMVIVGQGGPVSRIPRELVIINKK